MRYAGDFWQNNQKKKRKSEKYCKSRVALNERCMRTTYATRVIQTHKQIYEYVWVEKEHASVKQK